MILFGAGTQPARRPGPTCTGGVRDVGNHVAARWKARWPIGLNAYSLGTDWNVNVGCGPQVDLDAYFSRLPARSLTRVAVVSAMAVNKTGELDFTALDAVFDAAARHDQLLIPVPSASQDGQCENGDFKRLPVVRRRLAIRHAAGAPMPFAQWLDTAGAPVGGFAGGGRGADRRADTERARAGPATGGTNTVRPMRRPYCARLRRHRAFGNSTPARWWDGCLGGDQCRSDDDDYHQRVDVAGHRRAGFHDYTGAAGCPATRPMGCAPDRSGQGRRQTAGGGRDRDARRIVPQPGRAAGCAGADHRVCAAAAGTAGRSLWAFMPEPRRSDCTLDVGPADPLLRLVGN